MGDMTEAAPGQRVVDLVHACRRMDAEDRLRHQVADS